MKKFLAIFILVITFLIPFSEVSAAGNGGFDTQNIEGLSAPKGEDPTSLDRTWAYYTNTGTRYVIRIKKGNKYEAVAPEYYVNHIYEKPASSSNKNELMYLGADKTESGSYEIVKSGQPIFKSNYNHAIKWYNNDVENMGLSLEDIEILTGIIKEAALAKGDSSTVNDMIAIEEGRIAFDIRAEILFYLKLPGTTEEFKIWHNTGEYPFYSVKVKGNNSIETYEFKYYPTTYEKYSNGYTEGKWRKDYLTYREVKAIADSRSDDEGLTIKNLFLDMVACALFENDLEYLFDEKNNYQCSCDLYRLNFTDTKYTLEKDRNTYILNLNKNHNCIVGTNEHRLYMYYLPGRCGIEVELDGKKYYVTPRTRICCN